MKIKGNLGIKIVALILSIAAGLGIILGTASMVTFSALEHDQTETGRYRMTGVVYCTNEDIFYAEYYPGYVKMKDICVTLGDTFYPYHLEEANSNVYNGYFDEDGRIFDVDAFWNYDGQKGISWWYPEEDGTGCGVGYYSTADNTLRIVDAVDWDIEKYYEDRGNVFVDKNDQNRLILVCEYYGSIEKFVIKDLSKLGINGLLKKIDFPVLIVSIIVFIIGNAVFFAQAGHRSDVEGIYLSALDRCPYLILLVIAGLLVTGGVASNVGFLELTFRYDLTIMEGLVLNLIVYSLWAFVLAVFFMSTVVRFKAHKFRENTLCYHIFKPIGSMMDSFEKNKKFPLRLTIGIATLTFLEFLVICGTEDSIGFEIVLFMIYKIVEILFIIWVYLQLATIKRGIERVAEGDFSEKISVQKMLPTFAECANGINAVSEGVDAAVRERMKSERFKTELITNVSHDIKTPLTSIISYVDLIKKENVEDPKIKEYVEVLDRQSEKLKKLVVDLVDASKASSGALPVEIDEVNVGVLLEQVAGEFGERLESKQIALIVNEPKTDGDKADIKVKADGRHLWRVFDNLMQNIFKYGMPGTRAYIDVEEDADSVRVIFRNISKAQLNISAEELIERFTRGDSSRSEEGHGLGLNIADSLVKLMGGRLILSVDGDLFKAEVKLLK